MSIVQTVAGVPNNPKELIVSVSINGYSDFYTDFSAGDHLQGWPDQEKKWNYQELAEEFKDNLGAQQFLSRYDNADIYTAQLNPDSDSLWIITKPQKEKLINHLTPSTDTDCAAKLMLKYRVRRKASQYRKQYEYASGYQVKSLNKTQCEDLRSIIKNPYNKDIQNVTIHDAIPHYIRGLYFDSFI